MSTEPQDAPSAPRPSTALERKGVAQGDRHVARMALQRADQEAQAATPNHGKVAAHLDVARGYLELAALEWPETPESAR